MKFTSNKVIELGSAAFRQWKSTHSHCQYIHGYRLTADITFECDELDDKNWVADFGGLKDLKKTLQDTFDHKLVVAQDDPELDTIVKLGKIGVAEVVILPAVGCERFAEYVLNKADDFINKVTGGRVRVKSVQINEHDSNFATAYRQADETFSATITQSDTEPNKVDEATVQLLIDAAEDRVNVIGRNGNDGLHYDKEGLETIDGPVALPEDKPTLQPPATKPSTKTKGGWFDGTTWG